ncbi:hypothetical protein [Nocardioides sp. SR21]|uniref:hypothetical protein n=1 Tax=Nocardioides sp. SR21 TaxID=2919501 RepID=UPI001FAA8E88|nr:hypothetical protein [Nocardioides sp. SR21]
METVIAWLAFIAAVAWMISDRLVIVLDWLDQRDQDRRAAEAADHGEPSREQVEWEMHIAEAIALTQDDVDAIAAWDELEFAASVMADIDELPGGAA